MLVHRSIPVAEDHRQCGRTTIVVDLVDEGNLEIKSFCGRVAVGREGKEDEEDTIKTEIIQSTYPYTQCSILQNSEE